MSKHIPVAEREVEDYLYDMYTSALYDKDSDVIFVGRQVNLGGWGVADLIVGSAEIIAGRNENDLIVDDYVTVIEIKAVPPTLSHLAQLCRYMECFKQLEKPCFPRGELVALPWDSECGDKDFPWFMTAAEDYGITFKPYSVNLSGGFVWEEEFEASSWHINDSGKGRKAAALIRLYIDIRTSCRYSRAMQLRETQNMEAPCDKAS